MWDEYLNRFWVIAVSRNPSPASDPGTRRSAIHVALSDTDDAAGTWKTFSMDAMADGSTIEQNWCDYPQIGIDHDHVYFTCNMFAFSGGFEYAKIRVLTKSQFVNNSCCTWFDFWDMVDVFNNSFTVQPAVMHGAAVSTPEFLANAHGGGGDDNDLSIWRIRDAFRCCGVDGDPILDGVNYEVLAFATPADASQQDVGTAIDTGDTRLLYAFWKNGRFTTGQNTQCSNGSDVCIAYTEMDFSNGIADDKITTLSDWEFGGDGSDRYYPQSAVNGADQRTTVYARSSLSEFASAAFIGVPSSASCTNCADTPETTLVAGTSSCIDTDSNGRNRWGDYFGASPDPDGVGIWVHGQAATSGNNWVTRIGLTYESLDATAPVTTLTPDPAANPAGWNSSNVFMEVSASDGGSGVRFLTYSATGADPIPSTTVTISTVFLLDNEQGTTTFSAFAEDEWGNIETPKTKQVKIDKTDPVVVCGAADGLWHADNISISCTASDALSGLTKLADASFTLSTNVQAGSENADAFTDTREICDRAGNCVTAGPIGGNKIDRKAPSISITTPTGLPVYLLNQAVAAQYTCADGGSGVATCAGPVPSGSNLDTSSVGVKTFTVSASDQVGNTSSASANYNVTFKVCLLYDPLKEHASGSAVIIRVNLCDANDVVQSDPSIVVTAVSVTPPGILQTVGNSNPGNVFDFAQGHYRFNLSLKDYLAGSYSLVFLAAGDPVNHQAPFKVK